MIDSLQHALGKRLGDIEIRMLLTRIPEIPETDLNEERTYYVFKRHGLSLLFDAINRLHAIYLYSAGLEGMEQFSNELPRQLNFSDSAIDVIASLGKPSTIGGDHVSSIDNSLVPYWIRYDYRSYSLHIQFSRDRQRITLVTLMMPDAVPKPRLDEATSPP